MSLLGFDALGRLALGQIKQSGIANFVMPANAGAFAFSTVSATFTVTEQANAGAFVLSGNAATLDIRENAEPGSFTLSPKTATFGQTLSAAAGAFVLSGNAATLDIREVAEPGAFVFSGKAALDIREVAEPGAFVFKGNAAALTRTGFDYDFQQGGIGHLLEEMERRKQLNAITRKIPAPVDRRTMPRFAPIRAAPPMPAAPIVDISAVEAQRQAAAAHAAHIRRRREEEEILLLAS